jgi:hypothetical protein
MASALVFTLTLRPQTTFTLSVFGYSARETASFSLVVRPQLIPGFVAGGGVLISRVVSERWVDGTQAKVLTIENPTSGWQDIDVIEFSESF